MNPRKNIDNYISCTQIMGYGQQFFLIGSALRVCNCNNLIIIIVLLRHLFPPNKATSKIQCHISRYLNLRCWNIWHSYTRIIFSLTMLRDVVIYYIFYIFIMGGTCFSMLRVYNIASTWRSKSYNVF